MIRIFFCDGFVMTSDSPIYHFDGFLVEVDSFRVSKSGQVVALEPKAFEVLRLLLERPGHLITKEEILDSVWKDSFVTPNAMTRAIAQIRKALGDARKSPKYIETIQTHGYRFIAKVEFSSPPAVRSVLPAIIQEPLPIQSIAVLPLENLSGDAAQEYFVDGLTDELITEIAMIGSLRVISRTSTMRYKRTQKSLPQIAQELNVDAVLEGSVLRAGDRMRVTVQLISAARDEHLWAKSYEHTMTDVFALQKTVSRSISHEIRQRLAPNGSTTQIHSQPISSLSPQGIESYLQGLYLFHQWRDRMPASRKMLKKSAAYFESAIRLSPDYAPAYAALANLYRWMAAYGATHLYLEVERMARRALALDETLAEAHAALAYAQLKYHWDWAGAEREFQRAIQLNPNSPFRHGTALLLSMSGQHDRAIAEIKLAEQCDPLNLTLKVIAGLIFTYAQRYSTAIEQLGKAAALDPNVSIVHWGLGVAYHHLKFFDEAIEEFQKARELSPGSLFSIGDLGCAFAAAGDLKQARVILEEMLLHSQQKQVPPHAFVLLYTALGENTLALDWLERARDERSDFMTYLKVDARLDGLRNEPRFRKVLEEVGLSQDESLVRWANQRSAG